MHSRYKFTRKPRNGLGCLGQAEDEKPHLHRWLAETALMAHQGLVVAHVLDSMFLQEYYPT